MAISVKSRKAKGRNLQNLIAAKIRQKFNLGKDEVKGAIMGESGVDIQLISNKAKSVFPVSIEAKAHRSFAIYKHYDQATTNTAEGTIPALVVKGDRKPPLAVISFDDFIELTYAVHKLLKKFDH